MGSHTVTRRARVLVLCSAVFLALSACLPGANVDPKAGAGTGSGVALLRAVRVGAHTEEGGFDRVVFEFTNRIPTWDVRYVSKPVLEDPSGMVVPLAGSYAIQVRMFPASGVDFSNPGGYVVVYTGPNRINVGTPEITEVVRTGDFEAVLNWTIGTRHLLPFRVSTLNAPPRLVVDVAH